MSVPPYPKYKPSGVEWLGDVPEHWTVKRLCFVAEMNPSKSETVHLDRALPVSFLPMEAIGDDGSIDLERQKPIGELETGYTYFCDDDVTVAKITPCFENGKGAVMRGLLNGVGFGTTELIVARPIKGEITSLYLDAIFRSIEFRCLGEAEMYGAGGQKRVPESFVRNFATGIPPLIEQTAIAAFLDRETAKIDGLIAEQRRLIELLKEKRQAVISHAVTKGLNPHARLKPSGIEWLGDVPEYWDVVPLKRIVSLKSGDTITGESIDEVGEYPVLGGNGMRGYTSAFTHDGHYVVIGRQGALCGNINYSNGKFWASEHAVVASPLKKMETKWLGEMLRAMNLNQYSISAAQPGLSMELVGNIRTALPPIQEQKAIATFLVDVTTKLDTLTAEAERAIDLLQERRTALISAAVTGKIDVRGESFIAGDLIC
ncbi:hypothetical protein BH11PLA2_BH11PLA2_51180 [soil metagenome]